MKMLETSVGIERERFIVERDSGKIIPVIGKLLPLVHPIAHERGISPSLFGYELYAGQIEDRTPPCCSFGELKKALLLNDGILNLLASQNGWDFIFTEFATNLRLENLQCNPFDVRHAKIWQSISNERKLAASQVAACHVHLRVTETKALKILNAADEKVIQKLIQKGDHSNGRRVRAYRIMAQTNGIPPKFTDVSDLLRYIKSKGGERNVWDFVRYKPSTQTIEFRMFGTTRNVEEIIDYVRECLNFYSSCA